MDSEIFVRKAEPEDLDFLIECNRALALEIEGKEFSPEMIGGNADGSQEPTPWGFYLIAEMAQRPAGCLLVLAEHNGARNELFWWIQCVYVRPEFRRHGIYRSLYRRVKSLAQLEKNVRGLRLYVDEKNAAARQAYRTLGMSEMPQRLYEETL